MKYVFCFLAAVGLNNDEAANFGSVIFVEKWAGQPQGSVLAPIFKMFRFLLAPRMT